jgi:putative membrane protein
LTSEVTISTNELAAERTDLAVRRTVMAASRSLMAWVRTGLSMISFGFTLYKILQGFQSAGQQLRFMEDPMVVGLFLIGLGTFSLFAGVLEYRHTIRQLVPSQRFPIFWRPAYAIAIVIAIFGTLLFFGVLFRVI